MAGRADAPGVQAEKGNPGRRSKKVALREAKARRVAELVAPAAGMVAVPAPKMLEMGDFAAARAVWDNLAPELKRTHRLPPESQVVFVQLCVYVAEWMECCLDLVENGYSQRVKTVAGGYMERKRPVLERRERAFDNVLKLSGGFGLTPIDMYALFKDQALVADRNPGLFDRDHAPAKPKAADAEDEAAPVASAAVFGSAARLRSPPPEKLQ